MKFKIILLLSFLIAQFSFAQKFEGTIELVKKTLSDTSYYTYSIKNNFIRIDESDKYKRVQKSYLINVKDSTITALDPNQKIYTYVDVQPLVKINEKDVEIINTGIFKYINGYKCVQWRVRNKSANSEISYWIATENFEFFTPMAGISANIEDSFLFYMSIPNKKMKGEMPMLVESRTLLRVEKATYSVTKISKNPVSLSLFLIPNTYQNFQVSR